MMFYKDEILVGTREAGCRFDPEETRSRLEYMDDMKQ